MAELHRRVTEDLHDGLPNVALSHFPQVHETTVDENGSLNATKSPKTSVVSPSKFSGGQVNWHRHPPWQA